MRIVTQAGELPPFDPTATLFKGELPALVFSAEERREEARAGVKNWAGWAEARRLAFAHFQANPDCGEIFIVFTKGEDEGGGVAYGGKYRREHFDAAGGYHPPRSKS